MLTTSFKYIKFSISDGLVLLVQGSNSSFLSILLNLLAVLTILVVLVWAIKFPGPENAFIFFGLTIIVFNYFSLVAASQFITSITSMNRQHFIAYVGITLIFAGFISSVSRRIFSKEKIVKQKLVVTVFAVGFFSLLGCSCSFSDGFDFADSAPQVGLF